MMERLKIYEEENENNCNISLSKKEHESQSQLQFDNLSSSGKINRKDTNCTQENSISLLKELKDNAFVLKDNLQEITSEIRSTGTITATENQTQVVFGNTANIPQIQQPIYNNVTIKINDFTPEFDYLVGGSKMILCCEIQGQIQEFDDLEVRFDETNVRATLIQDNVIKCYIPTSAIPKKIQ